MRYRHFFFLTLFFFLMQPLLAVDFGLTYKEGRISYQPDALGNRILDYSYCGFRYSEEGLPAVSTRIRVLPQDGDMSAYIQQLIDSLANLPLDENGFRGAIELDGGTFVLHTPLRITASGIVVRGSAQSPTILLKKGYDRGAVIYLEGGGRPAYKKTVSVNASYVPVGTKEIPVTDAGNFRVGDKIQLRRESTRQWIAAMGCEVFGGGISYLGWKPGDADIVWDRVIKEIKGDVLLLDAPLSMALDSAMGAVTVSTYSWSNRISHCGIEQLQLQSDYDHRYPMDEEHAWTGISIDGAVDSWVRKVHFRHFAGSAVALLSGSMRITVEDCIAVDPVSELGGMRRSTFLNYGQLNLFQRCLARDGNHDFAVGYLAAGPNAFVQCRAENARGFSGAIDTWAPGVLFDIVDIDGHKLSFANLGQDRNGAGWTTGNSLFWQCTAAEIECHSPSSDAINRAYGCWAQFSGDGLWEESNSHVQPRSLFYKQLEERTGADVSRQARLYPLNTNATSSPTVDMAAELTAEARIPLPTMEEWIQKASCIEVGEYADMRIAHTMNKSANTSKSDDAFEILNAKLTFNGAVLKGAKMDINWWSGKLRQPLIDKARAHLTRFVPGLEGAGTTDRIDTVVRKLDELNVLAIDHNYGLWYERRRDDHQRVRRMNGDVWGPFYEQPFARSGVGTAWDGLSKYDLYRPNEWYWMRLQQFAEAASAKGKLLYHQHFFQHNIIEAGAHWVDSPWRTANNINDLDFPEPVRFAGDKRIFMSEIFYDVTHEGRRNAYRNYIREGLERLSPYDNVIHFISAEYTGPLHFMEFWIDVIAEWEKETGKDVMIALSATKDVQDAILTDPVRSTYVDIIDIRYWHYRNDGTVYAPRGGQHLAPRQHARLEKTGKTTFEEIYKAVKEYRLSYPEKAVVYYGQSYHENGWAVFMASGSCPVLPVVDQKILSDAKDMQIMDAKSTDYVLMGNSDTGFIIYSHSDAMLTIDLPRGKYVLQQINPETGAMKLVNQSIRGRKQYRFTAGKAVYWFKKQ